ncbi:MAG: hypothetical protein IT379_25250 [Deltaproteobacteria bacterium]|nr:hypothetical protein [Deltaproteobacteria bacterium]
MTVTAAIACANHPSREALGICVACKTRVCAECVTRVDGINYCVRCLETLATERTSLPPAAAETTTRGGIAWAIGGGLLLVGMTTLVLEVLLRG